MAPSRSTWAIEIAAGLLLLMQLWPVNRVNPPVTGELLAPADVRAVLHRSCYDCHSNQTRWPWYAHVAPASWLVTHDVNTARSHMNFSRWDTLSDAGQRALFRMIAHHVMRDAMPPPPYVMLHPDARLSADERAHIRDWALAAAKAPPLPPRPDVSVPAE